MEKLIITKNTKYLVAVPYRTHFVRWSDSKFDAVQFEKNEMVTAQSIANKVGGRVVAFNLLTGGIS